MSENETEQELNFNIDPTKVPVLYVDAYMVGSNEHVLTFNFAQAFPGTNQQNVISRVALTLPQAKEFLSNLSDHIQKYEL